MRSLLAASMVAALGIGLSACGGGVSSDGSQADRSSPASVSSGSNGSPLPRVKDSNDLDNDPTSNDDSVIVSYGHAASAAEFHTIAALVKRYYKVAATENGAKACSMLLSSFAEDLPEEDGTVADAPDVRGKTCAVVVSKIFKLRHRKIAAELPSMKVTLVRVGSETALVLLSVATTPEPHKFAVGREGHVWKIKELLDSGMP